MNGLRRKKTLKVLNQQLSPMYHVAFKFSIVLKAKKNMKNVQNRQAENSQCKFNVHLKWHHFEMFYQDYNLATQYILQFIASTTFEYNFVHTHFPRKRLPTLAGCKTLSSKKSCLFNSIDKKGQNASSTRPNLLFLRLYF